MTLLVVQSVDKQLVVLEQESCAKLRTATSGVKRRRIARQSCTWKIFVLHAPSPTADIHILAKTWHQQQDIVRMTKNTLIIIILSLRTWIHFHDVNLSILSTLCQQMKITEIIHIIFSLIVHQTTYQGPRVSVDVSGNLILCCEPQICCLALRAASHILESRGWIPPFG